MEEIRNLHYIQKKYIFFRYFPKRFLSANYNHLPECQHCNADIFFEEDQYQINSYPLLRNIHILYSSNVDVADYKTIVSQKKIQDGSGQSSAYIYDCLILLLRPFKAWKLKLKAIKTTEKDIT